MGATPMHPRAICETIRLASSGLEPRFLLRAVLALIAIALASAGPRQEAPAQDKDIAESTSKIGAVVGVVVDKSGMPVEGADVYLIRSARGEETEPIHAITDAQGRYASEYRSTLNSGVRFASWHIVAQHADHGIAIESVNDWGTILSHRHQISVVLEDSQSLQVQVVNPDGQPVRDATVTWSSSRIPLSPGIRPIFAVKTDHQGTAHWPQLPSVSEVSVTVESSGFGIQYATFGQDDLDSGALTFRLQPVGRLRGRVVAADPAAVRDLEVSAYSTAGRAETRTNDNGEFDIPHMPAGTGSVSVTANKGLPFVLTERHAFELSASESADVTIELERAIVARGTVLDEDTEEPVAGVTVSSNYFTATTNEKGEYEVLVMPAARALGLRVVSESLPAPYVREFNYGRTLPKMPEGDSVEFEPFYIQKGVNVRGRVIDETGAPVPWAVVRAEWAATYGRGSSLGQVITNSDEHGAFELTGLQREVPINFIACDDESAVEQPLVAVADSEQPLILQCTESGVVDFAGTIVDNDQAPVLGARVQLRREHISPSGFSYGQQDFSVGGFRWFVADADGRFRTPAKVPRAFKYQIRVEGPNLLDLEMMLPGEGIKGDDPVTLQLLQMQRVLEVRGIVQDRSGEPLPGVKVTSHGAQSINDLIVATTTEDGRFHLTGLHPQANFIFAELDGYRMTGGLLPASGELELTMSARTGSPEEPMRLRLRPKEERTQHLLALLEPILDRLETGRSSQPFARAVNFIAAHDQQRAIELLPRIKSPGLRVDALLQLGELEDALDAAMSHDDPYRRAYDVLRVAEYYSGPDKLPLLHEAFLAAQSVDRPDRRVALVGRIAEFAFDSDEKELAKRMIDSVMDTAKALPAEEGSGDARGSFAEKVVLFDPDTAMELVSALDVGGTARNNRTYISHVGDIAHELAGLNPAHAEGWLDLIQDDYERSRYGVRVCYRMAPIDYDRALRIAESLPRRQSPTQALGVMALALHESGDMAGARRCLAMAFDSLGGVWRGEQGLFGQTVALVGYADMIDPANSREYFWRALASHGGPDAGRMYNRLTDSMNHDAHLAMFLGLYGAYPEVQGKLLEPIFQQWESFTTLEESDRAFTTYNQPDTVTAMALYDPERTLAWHKDFHAALTDDQRRYLPQIWESLADAMCLDTSQLWRTISSEVFHVWQVDKEDY